MVLSLSGITDTVGNAGSGTSTITLTQTQSYHIFMTNNSYYGDISTADSTPAGAGGIARADAFCNDTSDLRHPGTGTYKALLVAGGVRVACTSANCTTGGAAEHVDWPLQASTTYYRAAHSGSGGGTYTENGTTPIFTTNSNGIFVFGTFTNIIQPSGSQSNPHFWDGLNTNWTEASNTCTGWTTDTTGGTTGQAGRGYAADTAAITYTTTSCYVARFLLCVEVN
jgi:hypothetical protein